MTDEEKFVFDLEGYFVLKNVLNEDELKEMNAVADEAMGPGGGRGGRVCQWGPQFTNLIDHPRILPYLLDLMGPKFRLDHDYSIFMRKGDTGGGLHGGTDGGAHMGEADHWYKYTNGVMRNGLSVFTFFLTPARQGDGGFACIPGSHKSNFYREIPGEVRQFKRRPSYVVQPEVDAGDALFFTEALVHGTMPWTADHQRRALLYKYSPGHSAWSGNFYNLDEFDALTDQQRRILQPPSIGGRPDVVART